MTTEEPGEIDYEAYVDGQLDLGRKLAVEDHLARHPDLAARMMSDLGARSALQLLLGRQPPASARLIGLAERVEADPVRPFWRRGRAFGGVAALGLATAATLFLVQSDAPPGYVGHAVASHRTAMMRAAMASQVESPRFDAREILSNTRIAMPALPAGWRVTDVQLFPADRGPALLIAIRTTGGQPLSIFAVREQSEAPERPDAVREGAQSVAYWRHGDVSYALTGDEDPISIDAKAEALAQLWSS